MHQNTVLNSLTGLQVFLTEDGDVVEPETNGTCDHKPIHHGSFAPSSGVNKHIGLRCFRLA